MRSRKRTSFDASLQCCVNCTADHLEFWCLASTKPQEAASIQKRIPGILRYGTPRKARHIECSSKEVHFRPHAVHTLPAVLMQHHHYITLHLDQVSTPCTILTPSSQLPRKACNRHSTTHPRSENVHLSNNKIHDMLTSLLENVPAPYPTKQI